MDIFIVLIIIGIILLIVELLTPHMYFLTAPCIIFIAIGVFGVVYPELVLNPYIITGIIILMGVPSAIITLYIYKQIGAPSPPVTTVATSLVGKTGIVIQAIIPNEITGKVDIENQIWSATSDKVIEKNKKIEVIYSKGVHVIVKEVI